MLQQQSTIPPSIPEQPSSQPLPQSLPGPSSSVQPTQPLSVRQPVPQNPETLQSLPNPNESQFALASSFNRSGFASVRGSKYNNKYSFKKHGGNSKSFFVGNSVGGTVEGRVSQESVSSEVGYWRSLAQQQEIALGKIREFAQGRRRNLLEGGSLGLESARHANSLSEIYNLSIQGNGNFQPLEFINESQFALQNSSQQVVVRKDVTIVNNSSQVNSQTVQNRSQQVIQFQELPRQQVAVPVQAPTAFTQVVQQVQQVQQIQQVQVPNVPFTVPVPRPNIQPQFVQAPQPVREAPKESPRPQPVYSQPPKPQAKDYSIPSYKPYEPSQQSNYFSSSSNNNALNLSSSNDLYLIEIRELRSKVESLQQERSSLIDKIRIIEKNNFSNLNSQETIQVYREEINQLKIQISELTELYNRDNGRSNSETEVLELRKSVAILTDTAKQYEQQLIQAQNHIIYLQNQRGGEQNEQHLEEEVKYLRETIAKYTQHVEQLDIERQKYHELLQQRELEVQTLLHEAQETRNYIESLENHINKTKDSSGGVSYDNYNSLIAEYGKKQLQVIILMEEINRLNYRYNELQAHLEKAEDYIIHIQEAAKGAGDVVEVREQYEAELARVAEQNNKLNETIHRLQLSIEQSSIIEKTAKVSSQSFMNHEEYDRLLQEISKREEETRVLSEEMAKINLKYAETRDHLEKAEDYIIHLQETQVASSPVNALAAPDTDRTRLEEELAQLTARINFLEGQLAQERQEREGLEQRSQLFSAEYEDMESRYKGALDALGKRYDQLLQQRNSITSRLSEAEDRLLIEASKTNKDDLSHLNTSLLNLDAQLKETREHLKRAQDYIESNMRSWQQASGYKQRHDEQIAFIELINRDLQATRRQNEQLSGKLQHFDSLVGEIEHLRSENEKLTIVVQYKENAGNATSLKQIDQVQASLESYTRLYEESEGRVTTLRGELLHLKQELEVRQGQLDQAVLNFNRSEATRHETEDFLRKAEEHILFLQQELSASQLAIQQLDASLRAESARSIELHEALRHAEDHIYHLQGQLRAQ